MIFIVVIVFVVVPLCPLLGVTEDGPASTD
jgi:hypothetical protein